MIKFHRDAQGEGGEFINKTSRYSFITHCQIENHEVVGSIEKRRDGFYLRDELSKIIGVFSAFEIAYESGCEMFIKKEAING